MLQIRNIKKKYVSGELTQTALDGVSFNLRENEFVAILGPSGSGKTTLLNVIGGLDRYDSGDLVINNISTKKYTDRDWDSYRNHTIGFVFQSYNLIPHQSVLANVELALTISGVSKSERRRRAQSALEQVGLGNQTHKKPNQMSGGQMQRVAIARALVNDPDILLADEPTGALDSETSVQVMDLLKEIAKDRLVVLVTHNQELADAYANRIINLKDGRIVHDTNPYEIKAQDKEPAVHKNMGKASMSLGTALSLSFNNLKTKKGRTILTSFAGSIGIIGIALILSLSTGVNSYITDIQRSTMASYPISIEAQAMDLSSMINAGRENAINNSEVNRDREGVYSNSSDLELAATASSSIKTNNLSAFKEYLDDPTSEIHNYIGEQGIVFGYNVPFNAFARDPEGIIINTDGSDFNNGMNNPGSTIPGIPMMTSNNLSEMLPGAGDNLISNAITDNYELVHGDWPSAYNELILVLNESNEIPTTVLYELGLLPSEDYHLILEQLNNGEEITVEAHNWTYDEISEQTFYLIPASDFYVETEEGLFDRIGEAPESMDSLIEDAIQLKISGIIRPVEGADFLSINGNVGYTSALTDLLIEHANNSPVVLAQEASPEVNVLNGMRFSPSDDAAKIADAIEYLNNLGISDKAEMSRDILRQRYATDPETLAQMLAQSEVELAAILDNFLADPTDEVLLSIYERYISSGSFDDNMTAFGMVSLDAPTSINLYADTFEAKDGISSSIANYNKTVTEENQITYTDYVQLLMSSVTTIVNVISYVLIAFVAVSLVVSSIMIGIITFISVLERTKEIGILRAVGASKRNISQVFNAETFIVGLLSGLIGIGVTLLLLIPGNAIIHAVVGANTVNAQLPIGSAILLVILSVILTLIAGLIPSRAAAKKDPVIALRSE